MELRSHSEKPTKAKGGREASPPAQPEEPGKAKKKARRGGKDGRPGGPWARAVAKQKAGSLVLPYLGGLDDAAASPSSPRDPRAAAAPSSPLMRSASTGSYSYVHQTNLAAGGPPRRNVLFRNVSSLAVAAVTCGVSQKPYLVYESNSRDGTGQSRVVLFEDDAHTPVALWRATGGKGHIKTKADIERYARFVRSLVPGAHVDEKPSLVTDFAAMLPYMAFSSRERKRDDLVQAGYTRVLHLDEESGGRLSYHPEDYARPGWSPEAGCAPVAAPREEPRAVEEPDAAEADASKIDEEAAAPGAIVEETALALTEKEPGRTVTLLHPNQLALLVYKHRGADKDELERDLGEFTLLGAEGDGPVARVLDGEQRRAFRAAMDRANVPLKTADMAMALFAHAEDAKAETPEAKAEGTAAERPRMATPPSGARVTVRASTTKLGVRTSATELGRVAFDVKHETEAPDIEHERTAASETATACAFYPKGKCRAGAACTFRHLRRTAEPTAASETAAVCSHFPSCKFGRKCRHRHCAAVEAAAPFG